MRSAPRAGRGSGWPSRSDSSPSGSLLGERVHEVTTVYDPVPMTGLSVRTPTLEIGYEAHGPASGFPIVLLHGFPDDVRAFDGMTPGLVSAGYRVLIPYLRGYGPTRFLDAATPRMAQQAAIGQDLLDFMDALGLRTAALAGYDWGGRAGCIAAILAPERVRALDTIGGYNVQDALAPPRPAPPEQERAFWYQWYFNTERGRAGLERNRRELCRLLWQEWSPTWKRSEERRVGKEWRWRWRAYAERKQERRRTR